MTPEYKRKRAIRAGGESVAEHKRALRALPACRASVRIFKSAIVRGLRTRATAAGASPRMAATLQAKADKVAKLGLAHLRADYLRDRAREISLAPLAELRTVAPQVVRLTAGGVP